MMKLPVHTVATVRLGTDHPSTGRHLRVTLKSGAVLDGAIHCMPRGRVWIGIRMQGSIAPERRAIAKQVIRILAHARPDAVRDVILRAHPPLPATASRLAVPERKRQIAAACAAAGVPDRPRAAAPGKLKPPAAATGRGTKPPVRATGRVAKPEQTTKPKGKTMKHRDRDRARPTRYELTAEAVEGVQDYFRHGRGAVDGGTTNTKRLLDEAMAAARDPRLARARNGGKH